ncbi:hypothetical protein EBB07_18205 [Paenibacillaceae bacterium]|nr:hypothetical protein EBB07_18205 [Paenibacillaceae bacterium]
MCLLVSCTNSVPESITGYAVDYADSGLLVVETVDEGESSQRRQAVWIANLKEDRIGSLLTVQLGPVADSYPALSTSTKTIHNKQPQGEQEILILCLTYAKNKWPQGFAVINSTAYDAERSEWEIVIGHLSNEETLTLTVDKDKTITEK